MLKPIIRFITLTVLTMLPFGGASAQVADVSDWHVKTLQYIKDGDVRHCSIALETERFGLSTIGVHGRIEAAAKSRKWSRCWNFLLITKSFRVGPEKTTVGLGCALNRESVLRATLRPESWAHVHAAIHGEIGVAGSIPLPLSADAVDDGDDAEPVPPFTVSRSSPVAIACAHHVITSGTGPEEPEGEPFATACLAPGDYEVVAGIYVNGEAVSGWKEAAEAAGTGYVAYETGRAEIGVESPEFSFLSLAVLDECG